MYFIGVIVGGGVIQINNIVIVIFKDIQILFYIVVVDQYRKYIYMYFFIFNVKKGFGLFF